MSFTLALQSSSKRESSDDLPVLIQRIHEQRGHFRNISEEGLLKEIESLNNGEATDEAEEAADFEKSQDVDARREELFKVREELRGNIAQAHNDALTALDFVSLLLSKDKPLQAGLSMSPLLKQMVPTGSLGYVKSQPPQSNASYEQYREDATVGWNFKNLENAADKLLQSAKRLETEMDKETKYWEQILSISERGWSLCRMPGERHTIGVRFGFAEAAPEFQQRDLAALRTDSKGDFVLDQGLSNEPKTVRVRIKRGNNIIGSSRVPHLPDTAADHDLEMIIRHARDSLFEEELFHELRREARTLLSLGVKITDNVIYVPIQEQPPITFLIDLLPLMSKNTDSGDENESSTTLATSLHLTLLLLLTHTHHTTRMRRTRPPPPLTSAPTVRPPPTILRTIINYTAHSTAVQELRSKLHTMHPDSEMQIEVQGFVMEKWGQAKKVAQSLLAMANAPLTSTVVASGKAVVITIRVTTFLGPPTFGTEFIVEAKGGQQETCGSLEEVEEVVAEIGPESKGSS